MVPARVPIPVGRRPYSIRKDAPLIPYDPDLIDYFFMVDGEFSISLIPSRVTAGRVSILLRAYTKYIVGNTSGLLGARGDHDELGAVAGLQRRPGPRRVPGTGA